MHLHTIKLGATGTPQLVLSIIISTKQTNIGSIVFNKNLATAIV
jgi:hypothetical protein